MTRACKSTYQCIYLPILYLSEILAVWFWARRWWLDLHTGSSPGWVVPRWGPVCPWTTWPGAPIAVSVRSRTLFGFDEATSTRTWARFIRRAVPPSTTPIAPPCTSAIEHMNIIQEQTDVHQHKSNINYKINNKRLTATTPLPPTTTTITTIITTGNKRREISNGKNHKEQGYEENIIGINWEQRKSARVRRKKNKASAICCHNFTNHFNKSPQSIQIADSLPTVGAS